MAAAAAMLICVGAAKGTAAAGEGHAEMMGLAMGWRLMTWRRLMGPWLRTESP